VDGIGAISAIVERLYAAIDKRLHPAAARNVLAPSSNAKGGSRAKAMALPRATR
jgi:hypothetical protein